MVLMDPNYQQPGQQTGNIPQAPVPPPNPYGFIMETPRKPKRSLLPNNNSMKSRLIFAVGGLLILIVAASIFSSVLSRGKQSTTLGLTKLAAEQQEIIRVTDLGIKGATDPSVVAYAETTKLTVLSQQVKLVSYLASHKIKMTPKLLATQVNPRTDAALTAAKAANHYDSHLTETLQSLLTIYANNLKVNYNNAAGPKSKTLLANSYTNIALLLKQ